jgi:DNA transformation protein
MLEPMPISDDYLQFVLEQLADVGRVSSRRLFGGAGLYRDDLIFGLIARDTLYFKVDDANRADYESRRMRRFNARPESGHAGMRYYEVPADILEDTEACAIWARRSIAAAVASGGAAATAAARRRPRKTAPRKRPTATSR